MRGTELGGGGASCESSLSIESPLRLRLICFCNAASNNALPFTMSPKTGLDGRETDCWPPVPPVPITFLGVETPVLLGQSRRGKWTFLVSSKSSVTHSSSLLLTENIFKVY